MFVLIIGGGRVGSHLANHLLEKEQKARLIEDRPHVFEKLHRELPTEVIHLGDPLNPDVLEQAGIREADVVVAATDDDGTNLAVASLAKFEFDIPRVIGRVNNPKYAWLFIPEMGVDAHLNQADMLSRVIEEQMELGDMVPLLKLRRGDYALIEEMVEAGAPALGIPIKDLNLPEHCVIAAILRGGRVVVPRGTSAMEINDTVLAVVDEEASRKLRSLLQVPVETVQSNHERT